jgi:hypothetical protein
MFNWVDCRHCRIALVYQYLILIADFVPKICGVTQPLSSSSLSAFAIVVLIIQIIVTLRLLLYFHHRPREKDEEHTLYTILPSTTTVPSAAVPEFPGSLRTYPRPYPTSPPQPAVPDQASSTYSVPKVVSNQGEEERPVCLPWPGTSSSSRERIPRAGSTDYDAHSESSTPVRRLSEEVKKDGVKNIWGREAKAVKEMPDEGDGYWG